MTRDPRLSPQPFTSLRLDRISRRFGQLAAVSELSLEVSQGEFLALLGPSGCGKSTTLACLAGLQPLSSGSIWRDEQRIDTLPAEKRGFGMVFQNYALFPHLSVQRNVEFGLAMRKVGRDERREKARTALRTVQLAGHEHKRPGQLSGGQQQRVAIARALAFQPQLVLMDEPLSNLDAGLRVELRAQIKRLHESLGLTTVYVTHDQSEALSLATTVVVMREGRVEQIGPPEQLHSAPESAYVARFMGYRNTFTATVEDYDAAHVRVGIGGDSLRGKFMSAAPVHRGDEVTLAIHPDDLVPAAPGEEGTIGVTVEVVEYHGRAVEAEVSTASGEVLRLSTGHPVRRGETLSVRVRPERVLVFPGAETSQLRELAEQVA
jgi:putative spermidine/putrescine transport system ATP-binding protein